MREDRLLFFWLELFNCFQLEARDHPKSPFCLPVTFFSTSFLYSPFFSFKFRDETLPSVKLVGQISRFLNLLFFSTCVQFSLFLSSSDLWNSRIIFPPLPGALTWPRNTNIWETSGHLHICWYIRSEPLCDVFLTAGVGLGEGCVGFWGAGQNLHLILSSQAI